MKNKIISFNIGIAILCLNLILMISCQKEQNVEKPKKIPILITSPITEITKTTAICGGKILVANTSLFEETGLDSIIRTNGVCWSSNEHPTLTDSKIVIVTRPTWYGDIGYNPNKHVDTVKCDFSCKLVNLIPNTKYYLRSYATNSDGVFYGNEISFITLSSASLIVTDADDNNYHTVPINTQVWLLD